MKLDGRVIAEEILNDLKIQVSQFTSKPKLSIILVGDDKASLSFIARKKKFGEKIGALIELHNLRIETEEKTLYNLTKQLNNDRYINGIIIQRPVPINTDSQKLIEAVEAEKDIDGFRKDSCFDPPLGVAINKILEYIYNIYLNNRYKNYRDFLSKKSILVIGRGETGGKPVSNFLNKYKIKFQVAHSKTINIDKLIQSSDIVISCVGKPNIVRHTALKKECILLGVGMHEENGKLVPDYEEDAQDICSFYTYIPGGVGPVNVACLLENLIKAYKLQNKI